MKLKDRQILLVISGGIAAYKSLDLLRRLKESGAALRVILTRGGAEFITPLSVSSLLGEKVYTDLFSLTDESEMGHIRLVREADLILIAPATANLMAKMAYGIADDLATTALLAATKPILLAPAMNVEMWQHSATQNNLAILEARGVGIIPPGEGDLACGETGPGRLAEVETILTRVEAHFENPSPDQALEGRRVLITAGPTREALDPIRYIANHSSGRQGYALATAAAELGAETVLISGPVTLDPPANVSLIRVTSAEEMLAAVEKTLPADIALCAAAVADWRPAEIAPEKIKKDNETPPSLALVANPDILAHISRHPSKRPGLVIGFAAETENLLENARAKRRGKGCDWILANNVAGNVFGSSRNKITLLTPEGEEDWPEADKLKIARRLMSRIVRQLDASSEAAE